MKDAVFMFRASLALCALFVLYCTGWALAASEAAHGELTPVEYRSTVDGDTVWASTCHRCGRLKVRLYAVDCPELGTPEGDAAKAFTTKMLEGKTFWLERDPDAAQQDRYGRDLAFIWYTNARGDLECLNVALYKAGLAKPYYGRNNSHKHDADLGIAPPVRKCK